MLYLYFLLTELNNQSSTVGLKRNSTKTKFRRNEVVVERYEIEEVKECLIMTDGVPVSRYGGGKLPENKIRM